MAYIYNFKENLKSNLAQIQKDAYISVSDKEVTSAEISEFLKNCKQVRRLTIHHPTIIELPDLSFIPDLYNLELICPEIKTFPKAHFPTQITNLEITRGQFKALPDYIWQQEKLKNLRFNYSEFEGVRIPENTQIDSLTFGSSSNLKRIEFAKNQPKLRRLDLYSQTLLDLDKSFENAENLYTLVVNAPIEKVHCDLSKLPSLKEFTTTGWNMEEYGFINNLPSILHTLLLTKPIRRWRNLPDLSKSPNLYRLHIEGCLDAKLADKPLGIKSINQIYLRFCNFENVPQTLSKMTKINSIQFQDLPPISFGDCMKYLPEIRYWSFSETDLFLFHYKTGRSRRFATRQGGLGGEVYFLMLRYQKIDFSPKIPPVFAPQGAETNAIKRDQFYAGTGIVGINDLPNHDCEWEHLNVLSKDIEFESLDFLNKMPKLKSINIWGNKLPSAAVLLREKTVPFDNLDGSLPDYKFKNTKQFCSLCSAIAKSGLERTDQEFLADYFSKRSKIELNKTWNWEMVLKLSNIAQPSFRKQLQALIDSKIAQNETNLSPKSVVYVTGKPKMKKTELKQKIEALGMKLVSEYSDEVTHVIIGMKSVDAALLAGKKFIPISDAELQQHYANQQPQYLTESADTEEGEEMLENLERLLKSTDIANVMVALEMIKAGGTPPQIFEALLLVQKTTENVKIRKTTKDLLEVHAPAEWKPIVRDRISLKSINKGKSEVEIRKQFKTLSKRVPPALAGRFSCLMYKHTGRALRYALTARLAKDLKKEAYQLLIKDGHFDFSKGLGYSPKPKFGEGNYYMPEMPVGIPLQPLELGKITALNLSNCRYLQIRDELAKYEDLIDLNLSDNYFTSLKDTLKSLKKLETINLSKNRFKRFPEILMEMPSLKRIDFSDNEIGEVPAEFRKVNPDCEILK